MPFDYPAVSGCMRMAGVAVLLALVSETAAESQSGGVFTPADTASTHAAVDAAASVDGPALRSRLVSIDFKMLARARDGAMGNVEPPDTLVLNLFDDVVFTGIVERTGPTFSGGYSLSGRIAGQPLARMILVVNGQTVAGTVRTLEGTYEIRTAGRNRYSIGEVDRTKAAFECEVVEPPASELQ